MESSAAIIHVPFRCPDCGDSVKFESLKDLRLHLQTEHVDLSTAGIQKKTAPLPASLFSNRSATPILEMYHADAVRIEEDLLTHKRNELNNKQKRMNSLSPNRVSNMTGVNNSRSTIRRLDRHTSHDPANFRQYGHSSRVSHKHLDKPKKDRGVKFNAGSSYSPSNKYDEIFRDDESLNDATRPDITVSRNVSRQIDKIQNISPSDSSDKNARNSNRVRIPESVSSDMDNHVRETLTSLSQEVVLTRANQQAAVDSLLASQEVYSYLEHSAQEKMCKQQEIIATLALKLSEKDEKLADLSVKMNSLRNQTSEEEAKKLLRLKSNQESEKILQEDLFYKQKELLSLTQRMENVKQAVLKGERERKNKNKDANLKDKDTIQKPEREINLKPVDDEQSEEDNPQEKQNVSFPVNQARLVERDMMAKEKELVSLRSKSMQLESDRQTLLLEMQALLEIAANDNEKLRAEMANQGKQLSKLNLELERSKQEQSELLGETNTLYYQADLSLSRLKHVLEERDTQLSSVSAQLEQAKDMQERLAREREEYLKVAVDKEASYQVLVQENALQLKIMKESLAKSQLEKESLQESLRDLKSQLVRKEKEDQQVEGRMRELETQLADQEAWQDTMREQIKNKEERLNNAKKSMDQMNNFMGDTAQKELEARSRLEQFISNLIDRSTQTETELKKLRDAYEAKEKAFKDLIEEQQQQLSSKDPQHLRNEQRATSPRTPQTWQEEAQVEIQNLSSYPSPVASRRRNNNMMTNATPTNQNHPPSSPPYHRPYHSSPNYDDDPDIETQEPIRLRSTIRQVKGNNDVDTVPERQMKNRPILVLGKEYPHPSAYGVKRSHGLSTGKNDETTHASPSNQQSTRHFVNTNSGTPIRNPSYKNELYLPDEKDEYALRPVEPRQRSHTATSEKSSSQINNSTPTNSHRQMIRNQDTSPYRLNNSSLFKNTPEVEKMYQNVQKHSYSSNPSNLSKKNSLSQSQFNVAGQRPHQLPMDEQGIIWGPYDRSGLKARAQKKKVKRKTNTKSNKKDNLNGDSDSEDLKGSLDSNDGVSRKHRSKSSHPAFSHEPAPLGDKIAHLLNSMGPGTVASNARREYEGHPFTTQSRQHNERDTNLSYSASESDSQHSSPINDARAVRDRVAKLTARQSYRDNAKDRAASPTPKARKTIDHPVDRTESRSAISPADNFSTFNYAGHADFLPANNMRNSTFGEENESNDNGVRYVPSTDTSYQSKNTVELPFGTKLSAENSLSHQSVPEKPMEGYISKSPEIEIDKRIPNRRPRPYIDVIPVENDVNDDSYIMSPRDSLDGLEYQPSLLNPYTTDLVGQLESLNAESEFSSSSYAPLHPGTTSRNIKDTLYPSDTEDDVYGGISEDIEPSSRDILADVHRELKSRGTVDVSTEEDKDNDDEKDESLSPSVGEVREMFQRSPMASRDSYFSRSSDSNRTSFQRADSTVKSISYDSVMKELLEKHPYINRGPKEDQDGDLSTVISEATAESDSTSEYNAEENVESPYQEIVREDVVPVQREIQEFEASENDYLSSDDYDDERMGRRQGSRETRSRSTSRADTMDASTDTDLEKLATPGGAQRSLVAGRKKKKGGSWAKKEKSKKQKAAPRLKDMARNSWTSVDVNDSEEAEREERLLKRRVRVALFCALAYADTKTLLAASQVCRDWRKITHHPSLWKHIELKDSQISSEFLITLSQWCTQAVTLSLKGLTGRSQKLMESEDDYHRSIRGSLESGLERLLFGCQGTLKSLSIQGCENIITDKCMWLVSSNCRMLTHLTYRSRVDPVHPQVMWALGGGCPGITSLYVHPYPDSESKVAMNNRCLLQIGQFYRDLQEVGLGGMEFNMAGLLPFIQSCQHLTTIHMDSCQALTDDLATALCRAGIKDLRTFTITGTAFQAKAITTLHSNCRHLKKIHATVNPQSCGLDIQKKKDKDEYKKLIKGYKDLMKKAGLSHILKLDIEEVE